MTGNIAPQGARLQGLQCNAGHHKIVQGPKSPHKEGSCNLIPRLNLGGKPGIFFSFFFFDPCAYVNRLLRDATRGFFEGLQGAQQPGGQWDVERHVVVLSRFDRVYRTVLSTACIYIYAHQSSGFGCKVPFNSGAAILIYAIHTS